MELFDIIRTRRSIRKYRPDPVPDADIITILQAANMAPSAMNHKPWEFIVVRGEKLEELKGSFARVIERVQETRGENLPAEVIRFCQTYGNAPAAIVVLCTRSDHPNFQRAYLESASAAMENLILAATALGLGTCWMTGPLEDEPALREILEIPENHTLVSITPIGYPDEQPEPHPPQDPDLGKKIRWM
jgi:nitroreductase